MRSPIMWPLGWRFERAGYTVHYYNYRSTRFTIEEHTATFVTYLKQFSHTPMNLVGHSLGGILAVAATHHLPQLSGRIVALGSPLMGSRAGLALAAHPLFAPLGGKLGRTWELGLSRLAIPENWDCAMIAGTGSFGIGQIVTRHDSANDGDVAVSETQHPGLRAHLCLPTTHPGMLFNGVVAKNAINFIRHGVFCDK